MRKSLYNNGKLTLKRFVDRNKMFYNKKKFRKEDDKMATMISKIQNINLSPKQRQTLGIKDDWKNTIPRDFVQKVVEFAEEHKKTMKELAKY